MAEHHRPRRADSLKSLSVKQLERGRFQPRRSIDGAALAELAKSIQADGVIQPLFVRKVSMSRFEIIAGERRWHAAKMAGLTRVPTVVRDVSDANALAISLIENLYREDLNPIDQAAAIQRLVTEFAMTHAEVAELVGRSRATVSNLLRLLELPMEVQKMLADGELDMGHARALLSLPPGQQAAMARAAVSGKLSVREVERRVSRQRPNGHAGDAVVAAGTSADATVPEKRSPPGTTSGPNQSTGRTGTTKRGCDRFGDAVHQVLGDRGSVTRSGDGYWHLDIRFAGLEDLRETMASIARLLETDAESPAQTI